MRKTFKHINFRVKNEVKKHGTRNIAIFLFSCFIFLSGILLIWVSTFKIPSLDTISGRQVSQSTKIYDSTGEVLLYDIFQNAKRTVIPFDQISQHIKDATLS